MNDFKQKYEDFYYDFARAIIHEQNTEVKKRLFNYIKKAFKFYIVFVIIAIPFLLFFAAGELNIFGIVLILMFFSPFIFPMLWIKPSNKTDEAIFKAKVMTPFLKIFGQFAWEYNNISILWDKNYTNSIIFPQSVTIDFDDYIQGFYKDKVEITINECKTEKLGLLYILTIFGMYFLGAMSISLLPIGIGGMIIFTLIFGSPPAGEYISYPSNSPEGIYITIEMALLFIVPTLIAFWKTIPKILYGGFKGLMIKCELPKNAKGHTLIYEKNLTTNRNIDKSKHKLLEQAKFEDIEFDRAYHVFTDDQIEARYILTTGFINRFKKLKKIFNANYLRVEFLDNKMFLIIDTGRDLFNFSPYKKLGKKDFDKVFEELSIVFLLIDELKLDVRTGL